MKKHLEIGTREDGAPFTLPLELVTRTLAIIGIRGWGKTVAATVIAEEMCEAGLPWVALDPVGVWWGLRCAPDGKPGGYPVVILGGEHADLPLEKSMGPKVADAILEANASCVIDMSGESKNTVRWFVTEFCDRLMELRPSVPRHIFLEEAPELVPQKPMGEQKRSLAAVDRLIRLGRNRGYGATLISQRFATINKDVLTQCENILAGRCIGLHDRRAATDWIAEAVGFVNDSPEDRMVDSLTTLASGSGWFWSPEWLHQFERVQVRRRKTYHPGETRTLGQAVKQVQLSDVAGFVAQFRKVLETKPLPVGARHAAPAAAKNEFIEPDPPSPAFALLHAERRVADLTGKLLETETANKALRGQIADKERELRQMRGIVEDLRKALKPQWDILARVFGALDAAPGAVDCPGAAPGIWDPWKAKLGAGPAKLIDVLLERGECTRTQLQTLAGYAPRSMRNHISRLDANGLIEKDGDRIKLRIP